MPGRRSRSPLLPPIRSTDLDLQRNQERLEPVTLIRSEFDFRRCRRINHRFNTALESSDNPTRSAYIRSVSAALVASLCYAELVSRV